MSYRFNGSSDYVAFNVAPINGYAFGALTWAAFLRRQSVATSPFLALTDSGFGTRCAVQLDTPERLNMTGFTDGPFSMTSTSLWYLCVVTWAGGAAIPRFHLHDGTSWSHGDTASNHAANISAVAGTNKIVVGWDGGSFAQVDMVCAGIKKSSSTDLAIETLTRTGFSSWLAFGFDWLIGFDASLTSAGALQDKGALGTGNQIAISGTSTAADPPGWSYAAAVTPVANFSGTPTSGGTPLAVTFTDASTNTPTSWAWTFGDGGTSTAQNPSHTYLAPGNYTVALTATNSAGSNTMTKAAYVSVLTVPPVADFSGTPTSGVAPFMVSFTDLSTNAPTSWSWSFGDGGTSTLQNPTHTYTVPGTYTVIMTATNSAGFSSKNRTGYVAAAQQAVYGPVKSQNYQDFPARGTCKAISYRLEFTSSLSTSAPQILSGTGPEIGAVGWYGADVLFVPLGLA